MTTVCISPECDNEIGPEDEALYDVLPELAPGIDPATRGPYCPEHFADTPSGQYIASLP